MKTPLIGFRTELAAYLTCNAVSCLLSYTGHFYLSGMLLIAVAVFLYIGIYIRTKNFIDFRALFSLSFIGGEGLACFKLSTLQGVWAPVTWICFALAYLCFWFGYESRLFKTPVPSKRDAAVLSFGENVRHRLFICIIGVTGLSAAALATEAAILGYVPILSEKPHAYSYFHISGLHYFTVSFVFVPALVYIYCKVCRLAHEKPHAAVWPCLAVSFIIPIVCVTRSQLIFSVLLLLMAYFSLSDSIRPKYIAYLIVVLAVACVVLTFFRHHAVSYLNSVFCMKDPEIPIFITQPYMYISNNYDNFNCLVTELPVHSFGLRMLFPLFALTGLKFVFPQLVLTTIYTTKQELTTLTMFYDAYYDFGIAGVAVFSGVLGYACRRINAAVARNRNPITILLYGQFAAYLLLSFFTTWFSNPTTWFWFAATAAMYIYVGHRRMD